MNPSVPMAPVELGALKKLLDYNRCDEETHYEECLEHCNTKEETEALNKTHVYKQIEILDAFVTRWDSNGSS